MKPIEVALKRLATGEDIVSVMFIENILAHKLANDGRTLILIEDKPGLPSCVADAPEGTYWTVRPRLPRDSEPIGGFDGLGIVCLAALAFLPLLLLL